MEPASLGQVRKVVRNPWVMGLGASPFLICLLAVIGALAIDPGLIVLLIHGLILGTVTTFFAWRQNPWPRYRLEQLVVEEDAIRLGAERIRRDQIAAGYYLISESGDRRVRLTRGWLQPDIEIRVDSEAEGRQLLDRLGLGAGQSVAAFRGMSRMYTSMVRTTLAGLGIAAVGAGLGGLLATFMGAAAAPVVALAVAAVLGGLLLAPSRIQVGADGLLIRWLTRERFISLRDVVSAHSRTVGIGRSRRTMVVVTLETGEEVRIPVAAAPWDGGRAQGLAERINEAVRAYRRDGEVAAEALIRPRGERSHAEWVTQLRAEGQLGTHRSSVVLPERLWRIVEDTGSEPVLRAAAAVALGERLTTNEQRRLHRVAKATASPRLRIALDAVAAQEEEALVEALAELESEAESRA